VVSSEAANPFDALRYESDLPGGEHRPPAPDVPSYALAGWWSRVGAVLVDDLVLLVPLIVLEVVLGQYQTTHYIAANGTVATSVTSRFTWVDGALWLGYAAALLVRVGVRNGQTFGKQATHIRILRNDGERVDLQTVLVREALAKGTLAGVLIASVANNRTLIALFALYWLADYLWPLWDRENRALHDLIAGTHVVRLSDSDAPRFSPSQSAPGRRGSARSIVTLLAVLVCGAILAVAITSSSSPQAPAAVGFADNTSEPPGPGIWQATATVTSSIGYADETVGSQYNRTWVIERTCTTPACTYVLTRQIAGGPTIAARLIPQADGWHATFPPFSETCGVVAGQTIYWQQHMSMVLTFANAGRSAQANERSFSDTPGCGYGTDTVRWTATLGSTSQTTSVHRPQRAT